jgi:hypothetical protein
MNCANLFIKGNLNPQIRAGPTRAIEAEPDYWLFIEAQ